MSQSQEIRPLSFEEAIRHAASHVTEFRGRARRSEFWWTKLLILLVSIFLTPVIGQLLNLATIPLTFRRLHDGGHSGWWWGLKLLLGLGFWAIAVFALVCVVTKHYDERINSNDDIPNPNINVLEVANQSEKYKNSVMAYSCWGTVRYILNDQRCGFPIQAGKYMPTLSEKPSVIEEFLDDIKHEMVDFWGDVTLDYITYRYASEAMKNHKPKVLYVSFGETDEFAHNARYDHYLMAAHHNDNFIQRLWKQAQEDPFYRDKTTFIVTTDHGRGVGKQWTDHGTEAERSEETWVMAFGKDIPALGEMENNGPFYNKQIAPTIAALLGIDFKIKGKNPGKKLFFVK